VRDAEYTVTQEEGVWLKNLEKRCWERTKHSLIRGCPCGQRSCAGKPPTDTRLNFTAVVEDTFQALLAAQPEPAKEPLQISRVEYDPIRSKLSIWINNLSWPSPLDCVVSISKEGSRHHFMTLHTMNGIDDNSQLKRDENRFAALEFFFGQPEQLFITYTPNADPAECDAVRQWAFAKLHKHINMEEDVDIIYLNCPRDKQCGKELCDAIQKYTRSSPDFSSLSAKDRTKILDEFQTQSADARILKNLYPRLVPGYITVTDDVLVVRFEDPEQHMVPPQSALDCLLPDGKVKPLQLPLLVREEEEEGREGRFKQARKEAITMTLCELLAGSGFSWTG